MKHEAIVAAQIEWDAEGVPHAPAFGDVYRPRQSSDAQAREVFLRGNGLPERWRGRTDFTVLETGFGLGHNFLATLAAWRQDPQRPERLHYVAVELHPPEVPDLERAHGEAAAELVRDWPPRVPGLHVLRFDGDRVRLMLAFGDAQQWLPMLRLPADAVYLDGFAPDRNPTMWNRRVFEALARRCAPGATAATWSVARSVRDGLAQAGFNVDRVAGSGPKREVLHARFAPRFPIPPRPTKPEQAIVIGAGLAGAAVAVALARLGVAVTVIDRHPRPAAEASGNPAGIFHGVVHPDDGPYARLLRAGSLWSTRCFADALRQAGVPGQVDGFLRLERDAQAGPSMQALVSRLALPESYVRPLPATAASEHAGTALDRPAWHFTRGGWVSPPDWVAHALSRPGIRLQLGRPVADWHRGDSGEIEVRDEAGRPLARAAVLVIATPHPALAPILDAAAVRRLRGQVSWTAKPVAGAPRRPLASEGYAVPLPDGRLLFGATSAAGDEDPLPRPSDHDHNRSRVQRLLPSLDLTGPLGGRVGWRVTTGDRLPLVGALPAAQPATPSERLARWPREPGIHLLTALSSRGLSWAPLLGELLAAQICGTPWPLGQDLADAVDPARFLVRALRQRGAN